MNSRRGKAVLAQVAEGTLTAEQAVEAEFFECRFYAQAKDSLSGEGCKVTKLTETSFVCECIHLKNFLSFFNKGAQVIQDSNYAVWLALPQITLSSLSANVGFYIVCTYWGLLFVFGLLAMLADKRDFKKVSRLKLLFRISRPAARNESPLDQTVDSDASVSWDETIESNPWFGDLSAS